MNEENISTLRSTAKPLTDEQILEIDGWDLHAPDHLVIAFARKIEQAHGIGTASANKPAKSEEKAG